MWSGMGLMFILRTRNTTNFYIYFRTGAIADGGDDGVGFV